MTDPKLQAVRERRRVVLNEIREKHQLAIGHAKALGYLMNNSHNWPSHMLRDRDLLLTALDDAKAECERLTKQLEGATGFASILDRDEIRHLQKTCVNIHDAEREIRAGLADCWSGSSYVDNILHRLRNILAAAAKEDTQTGGEGVA